MPSRPQSTGRGAPAASRLRAMDALRLLAAAAVMLFHFTARDHARWGEDVLPADVFGGVADVTRYGYAGVHLFFVISGFVILMSVWGRTVPQFVASRVSRLYPAYWAAVLLTATLRWWWPGFGAATPTEVLANLTMVHEPFGVASVDGVYWTLWVEMQFYLLVLGLVLWGVTARRVVVLAAVVPTVLTTASLLLPELDARVSVLGWSPLFGAGMVLYVIHREGSTASRWAVVALCAALAAARSSLRVAHAVEQVATGTVQPWLLGGIAVAVVGVVAVVALVPRVRDLDWRWLTALGALTYPLYLTHEYVGWAVIEVLAPRAGRWLTLLLAVAVCVALAWLLHQLVEERTHRPLRLWVEQRLTGAARCEPARAGAADAAAR